jgi:hypothetical protein
MNISQIKKISKTEQRLFNTSNPTLFAKPKIEIGYAQTMTP